MPPKKDIMSKNGMVDYYKVMPIKFILQSHNPNFKEHKLNLPFRMLIIGGRGAGKTQTLMNLIRVMNGTFNKIHIITKNCDEPLYNYLESKVDTGSSITEGIETAPNLDEFDKKSKV
jgi:septin family protein